MNKKKRIPLNPFVLTGYVSPDYFCDRQKETDKIISALLNGRNITLTSPRRMGKTGLIHHVFHNMQENNDVKCFYVDLYQTDSLELLVKKLADTIPGFKVDVEPGQAEYSLSEIFAYMEQSDYRCFVAFDEFQTIAGYADKNAYYMFSSEKMRKIGQSIDRDTFDYIYTKLSSHTWYVHTLLNRLYETGYETINKDTVDEILSDILLENEGSFQTFLRLVTPIQTRMAC